MYSPGQCCRLLLGDLAMPQPIRGSLNHINFDSDLLAQDRKLCGRLAAALNEWSKAEGALGLLLSTILKIRPSVATETIGSIVSFVPRLDVVKAAASAMMPPALAT